MAQRAGQAGRWVLPAAAVFLSLAILEALLLIVSAFVKAGFLGLLVTLVGALLLAAFAGTLAGIAYLLAATLHHQRQARSGQLEQLLRRQSQLLDSIQEGILVSDRAKAIAFREKERDALRGAIREDVAKEDWEAAYHLVDEMQRSFGYRQEAERLRHEIDRQRQHVLAASIASDLAAFRELLDRRDWDAARADAARLAEHYPDNEDIRSLPVQIQECWEAHKRHLLREFKSTIDRSEPDHGIELLRELDQYLTPGEAEGLQEVARGVFRTKLHNLGVQFSIAVSERNWAQALSAGEEIIAEFPNSRMAEEVRQNLDALRQRAGETGGQPAASRK